MAFDQNSHYTKFDSKKHLNPKPLSAASPDFVAVLENHFGAQSLQSFLKDYRGSHGEDTMTTPQFLEYLNQNLFKGDQAGWRELRVNDWFINRRSLA